MADYSGSNPTRNGYIVKVARKIRYGRHLSHVSLQVPNCHLEHSSNMTGPCRIMRRHNPCVVCQVSLKTFDARRNHGLCRHSNAQNTPLDTFFDTQLQGDNIIPLPNNGHRACFQAEDSRSLLYEQVGRLAVNGAFLLLSPTESFPWAYQRAASAKVYPLYTQHPVTLEPNRGSYNYSFIEGILRLFSLAEGEWKT